LPTKSSISDHPRPTPQNNIVPPPAMDCPATLLGASTDSVTSNSSYHEEKMTKEIKSGRTINFAEKLHLVLSNKECRGMSLHAMLSRLALLRLRCGLFAPLSPAESRLHFTFCLLVSMHCLLIQQRRRHRLAPIRPIILHHQQGKVRAGRAPQIL
jgi:hypothetical protein